MRNRSIETDTNKVYRKKYFMDIDKVVFAEETVSDEITDNIVNLIDAGSVAMSDKPVHITHGTDDETATITVDAIKDGGRIKKLIIKCPCGRHTEVDVEYRNDI
ncbi:MAG: hypothetical protein EOL87_16520 [Spartobacteria bacterium]|nr:hypothetical protein [Spartobacteria bacterium]